MWDKFSQNGRDIRQWLRGLSWDEEREKISQESQARVLLVGLKNAGKSTLFNRICGWAVSGPAPQPAEEFPFCQPVEDYGLFCLVDLPDETPPGNGGGMVGPAYFDWDRPSGFGSPYDYLDYTGPLGTPEPLALAEGADLVIYVLDGAAGVQPADYRWVARLRRLGRPLLVVFNKIDRLGDDAAARQAEIEARLATTTVAVSALDREQVKRRILPKIVNLCPELTIAVGREVNDFRRIAARRLIYKAALLNGLIALEPAPLLDVPLLILTLTGLMLRIGAIYDRPPSNARRREVMLAIGGGLAGRMAAQQLAKLAPVVGWLASGVIGWSTTWAMGQAAIRYFEAGGDAVIDRGWQQTWGTVSQVGQKIKLGWAQRPRLRGHRRREQPAPEPLEPAQAAPSTGEREADG